MDKKTVCTSSREVVELRKLVEQTAGINPRTPNDFIHISELILGKTKKTLSVTTLKRLWGYVNGYHLVRPSTLNILADYAGYDNWEIFTENIFSGNDDTSRELQTSCIKTEDLRKGDHIEIKWTPNRDIVIEFTGEQCFKVIKAENSKVKVGDTFKCSYFLQHEPLYVVDLVHEEQEPVPFVIGLKEGIASVEKIEINE